MFPLFSQFQSTSPTVRKNLFMTQSHTNRQLPVWVKVMQQTERAEQERELIWQQLSQPTHRLKLQQFMQRAPSGTSQILFHSAGGWSAAYSFAPWVPTTANHMLLPFKIAKVGQASHLVRSPDRKIGLADAGRQTSRIKEFRFFEAINYSYFRDFRFILTTCLLIGFSLWWFHVTEELFINPRALVSPDLELLVRVSRDTFLDHICSLHHGPAFRVLPPDGRYHRTL